MLSQLPLLVVSLAFITLPSFVDAALFPKSSSVTVLDPKGFRKALKAERPFVAAFVAPWCGHCQKLAPELISAATALHPLVPVYAIDCDDSQNKPICAEQEVKGFPTIKLFPQGSKLPPSDFDGTRTASSLFYWASGHVPMKLKRSQNAKGIADIVAKNPGKPKAVLMNKSNKMPLLWKVLSTTYGDDIVFINCRDRKGKVSVDMGFEAELQSKHKVLVYGRDDTEPILYEGILKFDALSTFFDQILEGSIDISHASQNAKQEVLKVPESERQDDTRIGDGEYSGFNPHDGASIEELMKYGYNPHGAGHPGAANPHAAGHAGAANPHAAGHPGAANPHAGTDADTKPGTASESTSMKSTSTSLSSNTDDASLAESSSTETELSSTEAEPSSTEAEPSSTEAEPSSTEAESSSSIGESSNLADSSTAQGTVGPTTKGSCPHAAKETDSAAEHTKDEL